MSKLKVLTYDIIKSFNPCYDPIKYIPKDWQGTALDILKLPEVSCEDKLWVVLKNAVLDDKTLRLFAVSCYRETLKFIITPDPRSVEAANVAEKFANGNATVDQLTAAESAAWSAAESARSAARSAAESARSAARSAAWSAESAAWSAESTAWSAAESAAWSSQIQILLELLSNSSLKIDSSLDRKSRPVFSGVLQYFPDAIMEVSAHSKRGNDKHNPGQPMHWAKGKSTDHADCIARHLIDIGPNWDAIDHETQSYHAAALAWRALALLQTVLERNKVLPSKTEGSSNDANASKESK